MVKHFRISVTEAEALIADHIPQAGSERVPVGDALHSVLREPVIAERDQPPFNRATMDGIAIASSAIHSHSFTITGTQAAGATQLTVANDTECMEVMTGAVIPAGCDTVIPVERIEKNEGKAIIEAGYKAEPGQFVHPQGSDHSKGDALLQTGQRIGPAEIAVLPLSGNADIETSTNPRIAVVSTGDELVAPGADISAAQIRSTNDLAIEAALNKDGFSNTRRHRFADNPEELRNGIEALIRDNDVLVLSGGVSMGKFDYLPTVLDELGVTVIFHKITQRPGLPMWFGVAPDGTPVFALPGNPVSSLTCLSRYVKPALHKYLGIAAVKSETAQLRTPLEFKPALSWFVPVVLSTNNDGTLIATPKTTNTSGDFVALSGTDGFIELPDNNDEFPAGYTARVFRW